MSAKIIIKILLSDLARKIIVSLLEKLAKESDNKIDDKVVELVNHAYKVVQEHL